jgi:hypothetical protein
VAPLLADLPPEQFAAGPLAVEPASSSMISRSPAGDFLDFTNYYLGAYRSQFAVYD